LIVFDDVPDPLICPEAPPDARCLLLMSRPPSSQDVLDRFRISAIHCPEKPARAQVDLDHAIALLDGLLAMMLRPLSAKDVVPSNVTEALNHVTVFSMMRKWHSRVGKADRAVSVQDDFNVLLQLASAREKLAGFGIMYISGCIASIHRRKKTDNWLRVMESDEFGQFMQVCQTLRDGLQPDCALLAEALEDFLDVDPNSRFAVLTKMNGTVKDICNYFRERELTLPGSMVKCGELTSRTKRARLQSLTAGQLNCLVTTADEADLLNDSQITLYVLFDCPEPPVIAKQNIVGLQDLAIPKLAPFRAAVEAGAFRLWQCCDDPPLPFPDDELGDATTVHEIAQIAEVPNQSGEPTPEVPVVADIIAMPGGDAEPIVEPPLELDEFSAQPKEVCQIESMAEVQFEASGNGQAEPSDIDILQSARADEEADVNVEALVSPAGAIEIPTPDQREQEPISSRGMMPDAFLDDSDAAGYSQDDLSGHEIISHHETSPSGSCRERSSVVPGQLNMPVADDSSQHALPAGGQEVVDRSGLGASIGNEEEAVIELEHHAVIEVEPPQNAECLDGGYDAGEETKASVVLPRQGPRFIDLLTDDSDDAYPEGILDDPQPQDIAENPGDEPKYAVIPDRDLSAQRTVDVKQLIDVNLPRPAKPLLDFLDDDSMGSLGMKEEAPHGQQNFLDSDDVSLDAEVRSGRPIKTFLESTTDDADDELGVDDRRPASLFLSDSDPDPESDSPEPTPDFSAKTQAPPGHDFLSDSDLEADTVQPGVAALSHRSSFLSDDYDPHACDFVE
jgi:hypothetical protein